MRRCASCSCDIDQYKEYGEVTDQTGKVIGYICFVCTQSKTMFEAGLKRIIGEKT